MTINEREPAGGRSDLIATDDDSVAEVIDALLTPFSADHSGCFDATAGRMNETCALWLAAHMLAKLSAIVNAPDRIAALESAPPRSNDEATAEAARRFPYPPTAVASWKDCADRERANFIAGAKWALESAPAASAVRYCLCENGLPHACHCPGTSHVAACAEVSADTTTNEEAASAPEVTEASIDAGLAFDWHRPGAVTREGTRQTMREFIATVTAAMHGSKP